MNIQKQVISLELARKLKKLGVKQESRWYYNVYDAKTTLDIAKDNCGGDERFYSAFTVAELGEMLPKDFMSYKRYDKWTCGEHRINKWESAETEADARARMLIYLLENGLIKI